MNIRELRKHIQAASLALTERKEEINRLNVFPVPDGDTGSNMSLTVASAAKEVAELPEDCTAEQLAQAITHGSLMGSLGNSGVITSQILRGLCEGLVDAQQLDAPTLAKAMAHAKEIAFQAVAKPVKGTILTVLEDIANASQEAADANLSIEDTMRKMAAEAIASVQRTPDFLPVLKENGVIDAGGYGLTILMQSFASSIVGGVAELPRATDFYAPDPEVSIQNVDDWAGSDYMYCTEFLLHSPDIDTDETRKFLSTKGDCELLVGTHPDFKVHVHTDTPGEVLNFMTERAQVSQVYIHNMVLESHERAQGIKADSEKGPSAGKHAEHKELAFVAVAAGKGMADILESLGVDEVVFGGQAMNPTTKDILDAIEAVNADSVIVFPNNKNIIMAAQAACDNTEVECAIIPTHNVPASFSAMLCANPGASLQENVDMMTDAIADIRCGEVSVAVRNSKTTKGEKIKANDVIGIAEGSLDVVGSSILEVTLALIEQMEDDDEALTLLVGEGFTDEDLEEMVDAITERFPDLLVDARHGDQPVYPVIFALE